MKNIHLLSASLLALMFIGAGCVSSSMPTSRKPAVDTRISNDWRTTATQEQVDDLVVKHPTWGLQIYVDVAEHSVHPHMTKEQVRAAWGEPEKITVLNDRGDESWEFERGGLLFVGDNVSEVLQ